MIDELRRLLDQLSPGLSKRFDEAELKDYIEKAEKTLKSILDAGGDIPEQKKYVLVQAFRFAISALAATALRHNKTDEADMWQSVVNYLDTVLISIQGG